MNIEQLLPPPNSVQMFRRSNVRFVPDVPGCYVLATIGHVVLYIGLANSLRRRMNAHLDNPEKTAETTLGKATLFYWIETPDTNKVERALDGHAHPT